LAPPFPILHPLADLPFFPSPASRWLPPCTLLVLAASRTVLTLYSLPCSLVCHLFHHPFPPVLFLPGFGFNVLARVISIFLCSILDSVKLYLATCQPLSLYHVEPPHRFSSRNDYLPQPPFRVPTNLKKTNSKQYPNLVLSTVPHIIFPFPPWQILCPPCQKTPLIIPLLNFFPAIASCSSSTARRPFRISYV